MKELDLPQSHRQNGQFLSLIGGFIEFWEDQRQQQVPSLIFSLISLRFLGGEKH
jgi:hypothetical protein